MKVLCSLKSAKSRDKNCKLVRRKGRIYVINKRNPKKHIDDSNVKNQSSDYMSNTVWKDSSA